MHISCGIISAPKVGLVLGSLLASMALGIYMSVDRVLYLRLTLGVQDSETAWRLPKGRHLPQDFDHRTQL